MQPQPYCAMDGFTPAISAIFDSKGNLFLTGRKKEVIVLATGRIFIPKKLKPTT